MLSESDIAAVRKACDAARAGDAPECLKDLIRECGGKVPEKKKQPDPTPSESEPTETDPEVVPPETDAPVAMGSDVAPELSEAEMDEVMELKSKAAEELSNQNYAEAINLFTQVLQKAPSPLVYAKRADAFVRQKKCIAAIRDCDKAIEMNPDSAKAFKTRGVAHRFLGNWEAANSDLAKGLAIDFDEDTAAVQKVVNERYKLIRAGKLKKEAEKRDREKAERERRVEEQRKAREEANAAAASAGGGGGFPGGMPGGFPGGMPGMGGAGMPNIPPELLSKLMSDPSLMAAMSNPKIMAALQECMGNPAAFAKYQNDPEVMELVTKLGGLMGGGMGGMGGMGGGNGNPFGGVSSSPGPSASGFEDVTDSNGGSASVEDVD